MKYVSIYCNAKAVKDARYAIDHAEAVGRCLAEQHRPGHWRCCCCKRPVKVVLR